MQSNIDHNCDYYVILMLNIFYYAMVLFPMRKEMNFFLVADYILKLWF